MRLRYGYSRALPRRRTVALGARLIVVHTGDACTVGGWDDAIGPEEPLRRLLAHLRTIRGISQVISDRLRSGVMQSGVAEQFVVHEDSVVVIKANTDAKARYCHIVAYFADAADEALRP